VTAARSTPIDPWSLTVTKVVHEGATRRRLTLSAFCSSCGQRRSEVGRNLCGHAESDEYLITESEMACAADGCVLMASDAQYPYCSLACQPVQVK
jgi:hypothetical protein